MTIPGIKIFKAKKVITMNSYCPYGTHVAVKEGKILGVGSLEQLEGWGDYELDETFSEKILMPGFVEGHCHAPEGQIWNYPYLGFFERKDPDGKIHPKLENLDQVLERLREADRLKNNPEEPLFAWGFDPLYFESERMNTRHLDSVSTTRSIIVMHASGHLINVNSMVLKLAGIDETTEVQGVLKDKEGNKIALTTSKIKNVFKNSCTGKVKSRVILNKFIEKVA